MDARCRNHLWFRVTAEGLIEVKCRYCAAELSRQYGGKMVVFHYYDGSGRLVRTDSFRDAEALIQNRREVI